MITSKNNELIKTCIQLKNKKFSREANLCLVESIKLVKELYHKGLTKHILVTEEKSDTINIFSNVKVDLISKNVADYICDSVTTDGIFAICNIPHYDSVSYKNCLVLDRIQDPSNLGAIIRSACAFGFETILTIDSVYPYSFKAIRSSMGHVFSVNMIETNIINLKQLKEKYSLKFYSADMNGDDISALKRDSNQNIAIIIGNEGAGVSNELSKLADSTISIPMYNCVESLNASVSAGIIMYLLR